MSYTETMINYVLEQYNLIGDMEETLDFLEDEINFTREEIKEMIEAGIDQERKNWLIMKDIITNHLAEMKLKVFYDYLNSYSCEINL